MKTAAADLLVTVTSVYRRLLEVGAPYMSLQELQDLLRAGEARTDLEALCVLAREGPSERLHLCDALKRLHQRILATGMLPTELVRRKLLRVVRARCTINGEGPRSSGRTLE